MGNYPPNNYPPVNGLDSMLPELQNYYSSLSCTSLGCNTDSVTLRGSRVPRIIVRVSGFGLLQGLNRDRSKVFGFSR